ncbi:MAG: GNAT family N-acetyltransferase [Lachnospiraceae bacterium]|nr:GNAT family N-acetyltransferase [Lachnospiraceae bacterium]
MKPYLYTAPDGSTIQYDTECVTGETVRSLRPLWEEVFYEDSPAFTDYYFQNKAALNTAFFCRQKETGEIISMVHLTPYEVTLRRQTVPSFYIVGVATKKDHRHRGLMAHLLKEAFAYGKEMGCPFLFLMPADPAIYEPFGFSYIYSRPEYEVPDIMGQEEVYITSFPLKEVSVLCLEEETSSNVLQAVSNFANTTLSSQYDYYLTRTPDYYRLLLKELKSQNGFIYLYKIDDKIEGYIFYAKEGEKAFVQELLFSEKLRSLMVSKASSYLPKEKPHRKPIIMARNLESSDGKYGLSAASYPETEKHFPNYVNQLANLKGCINELV